ncbi:prolyl tripeptidyl peptidase precursor [mine drainage metagenome]|uniref:Prolyl tripeptidyl peptidase n=1 Tax=mine drainage metagenome TaxID=410659 RepID=A0A1J5SIB4_9ZZZZ
MRKIFLLLFIAFNIVASAQQLTVEKIMRDPKWMGTSPTNVSWTWDSKSVFFLWNPDKNVSDSFYIFSLNNKEPVKLKYNEAQLLNAINYGSYNTDYSQIVYSYRGDLFLLDIKSAKTIRITQTEEQETNPKFILKNEWIAFNRNQNLYAWNIKTGFTQQLTNFIKGSEMPAVPAFAGNRGGGPRGNNSTAATANNQQEKWLQKNQLFTSDIIKQRKNKREQRDAFLKSVKEPDTLKNISIGDKILQGLQISPDGRFITYRLYTAPSNAKTVIVPDYITESGFTTDLPNRTKVGAPLGKYEFYVYDKLKDTVLFVSADSIPGITDEPDYVKDYPQKFANKKPVVRPVIFNNTLWNESGTAAIVDIRSQDNKDRWIMQLDAATGKLKLVDRQHDSAWIGGPGTSYGARLGWINNDVFYFQSEATGYSHLYTFNIGTSAKTQVTKGKYEVQDVWLSRSKQYFYLITNEEHPGKQNFYKIKIDGSSKEKITSRTGGYEVSISPDEKNIAYRYSYITKPWELFIQENAVNKKYVQITNKAQSDEFKSYAWRDTKIFTFTARDGAPVYAKLYEPKNGTKNKAAVIFVHGAGYLQNVHYWFSSYFKEQMFNNLLADKGYTVMDIDYRGSAGYGRDWRTGIYRYMGGKDLDDEVDAAKYLVKELGIDSTRIGMYGGSYGGFMTLMAMFTAPDVFKAGAALRPVTDWAHYNHGYTSNILNEPFNDSIAYARSSPINFANGLKNHLLICHGMIDLNVNFQDAVRLNQRLIELGKDNWQIAIYPLEDHGFVEPSSWTDEYKRILKLFDTWLVK